MRKVLLVSFDLIRSGEPDVSLSIGSILSYLRTSENYGNGFSVDHLSFNMLEYPQLGVEEVTQVIVGRSDLDKLDIIAVSCYVWSEHLINPLIDRLRSNGFSKTIALGGYQISYSNNLKEEYPDCQVFIEGYAESSLLDLVQGNFCDSRGVILNAEPDFASIPSPYLSNVMLTATGQVRVRMETKRGCPYRCSFCAHRDLQRNLVYKHHREKVSCELQMMKTKQVKKINVVDPVFNAGADYIWILERAIEIGLKSQISVQTRLENIRGSQGDRFLELSSNLDMVLEFGLQSIHSRELEAVNRVNDLELTKKVLKQISALGIPFEVSLIYGLPNQTVESFVASIEFLKNNGCERIKAFPLMLLKGTELWADKRRWGFIEKAIGDFHIPLVVASNSFDEADWRAMKEIAEDLEPADRIQ